MPNKKISQLTDVGDVQVDDLFPLAENAGGGNVALGYRALKSLDNDDGHNIAIGHVAGNSITGSEYNVIIGNIAGQVLTTGNHNTLIGYDADVSTGAGTGQIAIGKGVACVADNTITVGIGANTGSLGLDGSDTSWAAASSDERLKENIETCAVGLSFVNDLRPVTYNWKKAKDVSRDMPQYKKDSEKSVLGFEYGTAYHGFIAQEVKQAIDKYDGIKESFKMWQLRDDGTQTVAPAAVIPMLVKAVQELTAKVEALENK